MDFRFLCGAKNKWYSHFDTKRFLVFIDPENYIDYFYDEFETDEQVGLFLNKVIQKDNYIHLPFEFKICPSCNGIGSYVDPNIDSQGITTDDWNNWSEDDKENYFNGFYDITCQECNGEKIVPTLTKVYNKDLQLVVKMIKKRENDYYNDASERYMEWKMGY